MFRQAKDLNNIGHSSIRELNILRRISYKGDLTGIGLLIIEIVSLRLGFSKYRLARRSI